VSLLPVGPVRVALTRDDAGGHTTIKPRKGYQLGAGANALIVLHRVAFYDDASDTLDKTGQQAVLNWAASSALGQDDQLIATVADRRTAALRRLRDRGRTVARLHAVPEWRLAVGLGNRANPYEIGFSLHGTYGWPVIPGSSLKGLAAAWAAQLDVPDETLRAVFGSPRPAAPPGRADPARGGVWFLDAIPAARTAPVVVDVLTPHVKPYYDDTTNTVPPAEHHSPVPVNFLTVTGAFAVDLVGDDRDLVDAAVTWLADAADNLGAGAKTAAGYGYLHVERIQE